MYMAVFRQAMAKTGNVHPRLLGEKRIEGKVTKPQGDDGEYNGRGLGTTCEELSTFLLFL